MLQVRKSNERGRAQLGWLDSRHTFSFSSYYDPKYTGFRDLLVINEDRVQPGQGFGKHGHKDMEIITYVHEGELAHKDNMGSGSVIQAGGVQRMSAGKGVLHSEFNHSKEGVVHFFQIWITPNVDGLQPSYEEKFFQSESKKNRLKLIVSPNGEDDSIKIHQDVKIFATLIDQGKQVSLSLQKGRYAWIQIIKGSATVNGVPLELGDGVAISDETDLNILAAQATEALVFDLS